MTGCVQRDYYDDLRHAVLHQDSMLSVSYRLIPQGLMGSAGDSVDIQLPAVTWSHDSQPYGPTALA